MVRKKTAKKKTIHKRVAHKRIQKKPQKPRLPRFLTDSYYRPFKPKKHHFALFLIVLVLLIAGWLFLRESNCVKNCFTSQPSLTSNTVLVTYEQSPERKNSIRTIESFDPKTNTVSSLERDTREIEKFLPSPKGEHIVKLVKGSLFITSTDAYDFKSVPLTFNVRDTIWTNDSASLVLISDNGALYRYYTNLSRTESLQQITPDARLLGADTKRDELYYQTKDRAIIVASLNTLKEKIALPLLPNSPQQTNMLIKDGIIYYTAQRGDIIGNSEFSSKIYSYNIDTKASEAVYESRGIRSVTTTEFTREPTSQITTPILDRSGTSLYFGVEHWNEQESIIELISLNLQTKETSTLYTKSDNVSKKPLHLQALSVDESGVLILTTCSECVQQEGNDLKILAIVQNSELKILQRRLNTILITSMYSN